MKELTPTQKLFAKYKPLYEAAYLSVKGRQCKMEYENRKVYVNNIGIGKTVAEIPILIEELYNEFIAVYAPNITAPLQSEDANYLPDYLDYIPRFLFNSSYDWLMPVVRKVMDELIDIMPNKEAVDVARDINSNLLICMWHILPLYNAVYRAIVYINSVNQNKQ